MPDRILQRVEGRIVLLTDARNDERRKGRGADHRKMAALDVLIEDYWAAKRERQAILRNGSGNREILRRAKAEQELDRLLSD